MWRMWNSVNFADTKCFKRYASARRDSAPEHIKKAKTIPSDHRITMNGLLSRSAELSRREAHMSVYTRGLTAYMHYREPAVRVASPTRLAEMYMYFYFVFYFTVSTRIFNGVAIDNCATSSGVDATHEWDAQMKLGKPVHCNCNVHYATDGEK